MSKGILKGYLCAIISAVIYGCMPLVAKNIYADGVTPFTLVFLRNVFAVLPLGVLAYGQSKTIKIPLKYLPTIAIIAAVGCTLTPLLLFSSYNYMPSGAAMVIHFIYPAAVVLGEIIFLRKKNSPSSILAVVLSVLGVAFFYTPGQSLSLVGSAIALISGITYAAYVVLLAHFGKDKIPIFLLSFYIVAFSSVYTFIVCVATDNLVLPSNLTYWFLCLGFALVVSVGAVVLFQRGVFLIGGAKATVLSTLEPITGVLVGMAAFNERMTIGTALGTLLVVAASVIIAIPDLKKQKN